MYTSMVIMVSVSVPSVSTAVSVSIVVIVFFTAGTFAIAENVKQTLVRFVQRISVVNDMGKGTYRFFVCREGDSDGDFEYRDDRFLLLLLYLIGVRDRER